ncbi:MAG TPA: zinc ribbon domain-containing protein [Thermoleophilaceae bacterium]|nr:zinc ribbon domain-containing protein [Thermoleophilaceae bacterium]
MSPFAVFGITSDGLNLVVNLLLLFLVVFWIALIYWTYADARRRIADPMLVGCATAASLFPFAGTAVYMIVRPPEYLEDVRERELDIAAAEVRLAAIEHLSCSYCNFEIERSFLRCPNCLRRLTEPCSTCSKPLDPSWKICPYCESEIGQPAPQPRRRARPAAASGVPPQRQPAPSGEAHRRDPSAQRVAAASGDGQRRAPSTQRPHSGPGDPQRRAPAGEDARRAAPSGGEGQRQATPGGAKREGAVAKRPARAAAAQPEGRPDRDGRTKRPPRQAPPAREGGEPQPPAEPKRQKRSGAPSAKRPASQDAVTAEQPVARPRTRPPSAG